MALLGFWNVISCRGSQSPEDVSGSFSPSRYNYVEGLVVSDLINCQASEKRPCFLPLLRQKCRNTQTGRQTAVIFKFTVNGAVEVQWSVLQSGKTCLNTYIMSRLWNHSTYTFAEHDFLQYEIAEYWLMFCVSFWWWHCIVITQEITTDGLER